MSGLEDLIGETQSVVGALIKKPKLTEKLLSRPPFRFIHDVVMGMNAKSGFLDALLSDEEKDSGNIKDKESKLNFLTKVVDFASVCDGSKLSARPTKIVAGLEPEHTNALLIALGKACTSGSIDFAKAAAQALGHEVDTIAQGEGKVPDEGKAADQDGEQAAREAAQAKKVAAEEEERQRRKERRRAREREEAEERAKQEQAAAASQAQAQDGDGADESELGGSEQKEAGDFDTSAVDGQVETTITLFQGLITKPKLSEKLLSKPPFRFLHDVLSALTKATGLMEGLYQDAEETDSRHCAEKKERKIAYLDKAIAFAQACAPGANLQVKPGRVVAGHEADNTNAFLQVLALVARNDCQGVISSLEAVDHALGRSPAASTSKPPSLGKTKHQAEDQHQEEPERREVVPLSESKEPEARNESKDSEAESKPIARPQTARKRPPKIKDKATAVSSKSGARNATGAEPTGPVGVMMDGQESDEGDDMSDADEPNPAIEQRERRDVGPAESGENKSKLVRDILDDERKTAEQKDELSGEEKSGEKSTSAPGITMGKIGQGMRRGSTKLGNSSASTMGVIQVDKISAAIQTLCQSTNPLGKCMDHIHDDLATMSKELDRWRTDYRKSCDAIEDERRATNETLHPLRGKLLDVDERIKDEQAKLSTLNASIAKNDHRIAELLRDMVLN